MQSPRLADLQFLSLQMQTTEALSKASFRAAEEKGPKLLPQLFDSLPQEKARVVFVEDLVRLCGALQGKSLLLR